MTEREQKAAFSFRCFLLLLTFLLFTVPRSTVKAADFESSQAEEDTINAAEYNQKLEEIRREVLGILRTVGMSLCVVSIAYNAFYFYKSADEVRIRARDRIFYSVTALVFLILLPKMILIFSGDFGIRPWSP